MKRLYKTMWRALSVCFLVTLGTQLATGQAPALGDYRSVTSGFYEFNTTWEYFDGTSWGPAANAPTANEGIITILSGHSVTLQSDEIIDHLVIQGTLVTTSTTDITFPTSPTDNVIQIDPSGVLDLSASITLTASTPMVVSGNIIARNTSSIIGATASNLSFLSGGVYQHLFSSVAGTIPLASWDPGATMWLRSSNSTLPANMNQSFGGVRFDMTTSGSVNMGTTLTTVRGDFTVGSGQAKTLLFGAPLVLKVGGSFSVAAGTMNFVTTAGNNDTIRIAKNFSFTGGAISKSGAATVTLKFVGPGTQTFTNTAVSAVGGLNYSVESGSILDMGSSAVNGAGTFTLKTGGTFRAGSTNATGAIASGTTVGNIKVASRTYQAGSTIEYGNATNAAQFLGAGHPSTTGVNTVINTSGGVKLATSTIAFNGNVTLTSGNLDISGGSVTFAGVFTPGSNSLVADFGTSVTINDAASTAPFGLLKFANTQVIESLTLDGTTGRNVSLGSDLAVSDDIALDAGDLNLNGFTLNIQGGIDLAGGTLTSTAASGIKVSDEGVGTLPADFTINGGAINTLTMNRLGNDLATSSDLDIKFLNLVAGSFTTSGIVRMASQGKITVADGVLTNAVGAIDVYDVTYNGSNDILTAAELPPTGTILRDLTSTNPSSVTLSNDAIINGNFNISAGSFFGAGNTVTFVGNIQADGNTDFHTSSIPNSPGAVFFDGTTVISGSIAPQFGHVTVNAGKSLTINSNLQVNVGGDFTMDGTFTPGTGRILFDSALSQTISRSVNTNPITFYQIELNKTAGDVTLSTPADIQDLIRITSVSDLNVGTDQLRLLSTAARTARINPVPDLANINGSLIVQRFLPNGDNTRQYRYLTPTVTGTSAEDWRQEVPITGTFDDPSTGAGINSTVPSLYYYDEATSTPGPTLESRYVAYPASGPLASAALTNGQGYALFIRSSTGVTLDTHGPIATHSQPINVTAQSASGNDGWNLIGNPFPSPVALSKITRSGTVDNAVYIRDNTAITNFGGPVFVTYINGVSSPASFDGSAASGQAFWVHATGAGTVTFDETDKVISTDSLGQYYRTAPLPNLLRVSIANSSQSQRDEAVVRFLDQATDNFDKEYDALKIPSLDLKIATTLNDGRAITINTLGSLSCDKVVPLTVGNVTTGTYSITASGFESFGSDVNVYLRDKKTGSLTDLRTAAGYSLTVTTQNKDSLTDRFALELGKSRLLLDLQVANAALCHDDSTALVYIHLTQPEVDYRATIGGAPVSNWLHGNGGDVRFAIPAHNLATETQVSFEIRNACHNDQLARKAIIRKGTKPVITGTIGASVCQSGPATLQAFGATADQVYNWYRSADAPSPLETTSDGKLVFSNITASASYFVAIADTAGCESTRTKVDASVVSYDNLVLTQEGDSLVSSYAAGNTWYRDGVLINNASSNIYVVTESGLYTAKVSVEGCVAQASQEVQISGLDKDNLFGVYPNPVSDKMMIRLNNPGTGEACVDITSTAGVSVYKECFATSGNATLTIPVQSLATGVYVVRVTIGSETLTSRIAKN